VTFCPIVPKNQAIVEDTFQWTMILIMKCPLQFNLR
jgi:hypothetical protein